MDSIQPLETNKRLIVLIPDCLAGSIELAHKVHWLAVPDNSPVLYVTLVDDDENNLTVSRSMATLNAVTSANLLTVESKLTTSANLLNLLGEVYHTGDVIICQKEQTIASGFSKAVPLCDYLSSHLDADVFTLAGYYQPYQTRIQKGVFEFFSLMGFLVIIAAFTWLEIELDQTLDGTLQGLLIMIVFCVEMGAIWTWHQVANR